MSTFAYQPFRNHRAGNVDNANFYYSLYVEGQNIALELRSAATTGPCDALLVIDDPFTFLLRKRIVELAAKSQLPAMYGPREFAVDGGLMAYGANIEDMFRRAAAYVAKILEGAKPADLPVQQPTRFDLVINLKTIKALGLAIPQSLVTWADEVIILYERFSYAMAMIADRFHKECGEVYDLSEAQKKTLTFATVCCGA